MKVDYFAFVFAGILAYSGFVSAGGPDIRPGLWNYQVSINSQSGQIEAAMAQAKAALANMPPEQRAMMEQMMESSGAKFDLSNQTFETCITKEDIQKMSMPNPDDKCEQTLVKKSASKYKMTVSCKGNPPMNGEGDFTIISDKEMKGVVVMSGVLNGQPEKMTMNQNAKWISGTCQEN